MEAARNPADPRRESAIDPYQPLLRLLDRYRHDVHVLEGASTVEALRGATAALGVPVPVTLLSFLERWNGANLFRGALRVRTARELAPAATEAPEVILFADGPTEADRWAFVADEQGGSAFGRWHPARPGAAHGAFEPLHERFDRWLFATLRVLDENLRDEDARIQARIDVDPDCGYLLLRDAERCLTSGDPDRARALLKKATAADPGLVGAWVRLGETLVGEDDAAARFAFLRALRAIRLPARFPVLNPVEPSLLRDLGRLFPPGDAAWERELEHFHEESVHDVHNEEEAALSEAAAVELGRVFLARGDRRGAAEKLVNWLERARGFHHRRLAGEVVLLLVRVEVDLGLHDEAERHLRLLRDAPPALHARGLVELGRLATLRQEPWAEEILAEAIEALDPRSHREAGDPWIKDRCEALLLLSERHRLYDRLDRAADCLEMARVLADRSRNARLAGLVLLGLGDTHSQRGEHAQAEAAYRGAQEKVQGDSELLQRVLVRRGDLYALTGDADRAAADYARAADGFGGLGLPLREAWARLRLARLGFPAAAETARSLFKAADLAAGVAAADASMGDPARSVDWHLERSAEHARDRGNAQRARPPLSRADAERPERRIGAHRMAVAACDVRVVQILGGHLDSAARSLDLATPRVTDPNLARYVAAADLLSAHRSYEAAEVLLRHLLEVRPGGAAGRALVGAMARSSNAALVSGLLDALEGGFDPTGMSAAAEVLGWRRELAAVPTLRRLCRSEYPSRMRRAAIIALGRVGDHAAIDDLIEVLDEPELSEDASTSLLLLGEWKGVDMQAQALATRRPTAGRSLGEIVGRYGGPSYLLLLYRTAEQEGPAGFGALQGLGYLGDPRAVPRLIDALGSRDNKRARVANAALEVLSGHPEDPEESLLRNRWVEWWERMGGRFQEGQRYRHGRLMDPGTLVDRLGHDDPMVRRLTYDELVISTGARLPFDAEGPWRVQRAHQLGWAQWWRENRGRFPSGRWTFHGEAIR
jgi:tetratricopeptide (TPR) repeat protein